MKYKIVCDSSSNVTSMTGIEFASAPLKIIMGDREYVDNSRLDTRQMVTELGKYRGKTSTACPSVGDWLDAFGNADIIFGVTITSGLSGSYMSAMSAKNEYLRLHPDAQVHITDSLSTGPEMQLIAEKLREYIVTGHSFEWICAAIEKYADRSHLLFALESYSNLANNGRVNPAVAKIAGVLGIIITGAASPQGVLDIRHKCRGRKSAVKKLTEDIYKSGYCGGKIRVAHCFNPEFASSVESAIRRDYPDCDFEILPTTGLCSYYAEERGILIGYETDPPQS